MIYSFLADLVVAFHLGYVGFVIFGQLAILVGLACRWGWVRNFWFRLLHLAAIAVVALESIWDITCPLTDLEGYLREQAGEHVEAGSFIGRLLDSLLFFSWPDWVFTVVYIGFALLVLATFILAPPRWKKGERAMVN